LFGFKRSVEKISPVYGAEENTSCVWTLQSNFLHMQIHYRFT